MNMNFRFELFHVHYNGDFMLYFFSLSKGSFDKPWEIIRLEIRENKGWSGLWLFGLKVFERTDCAQKRKNRIL